MFSDGRWTLEGLLEHSRRERFASVAITDHDRVDKVATVQRTARALGVPVLAAVEMTTEWDGGLVDLLCFGFDPAHGALDDLAQRVWALRQENSREVCDDLRRRGYDVGPEALARVSSKPSAQQPRAWVDLLEERGVGAAERGGLVRRAGLAFATNDPVAVVEAAHRGGGVPGVRPAARSADQRGVRFARTRAAPHPVPRAVVPRFARAAGRRGGLRRPGCSTTGSATAR